ncbi:hypothetical protein I7I50_09540 [Histoplasma capsulatum G186AR]|uniref:Uncharacterized protein n=1 Tax=Ajellomyces capsulatus TaxID=5037 RepID=A0A8H7YVF4_AJECA|nr:hypothetical protein I7I52_07061 [Histoplasma capsulatum]QSS74398.1 hypothetical protein I7I50_09540 [Histoplasma capsulatum G186AR]
MQCRFVVCSLIDTRTLLLLAAVPFLVLEPITADEQEWPYIQVGHENGNLQLETSAMHIYH